MIRKGNFTIDRPPEFAISVNTERFTMETFEPFLSGRAYDAVPRFTFEIKTHGRTVMSFEAEKLELHHDAYRVIAEMMDRANDYERLQRALRAIADCDCHAADTAREALAKAP